MGVPQPAIPAHKRWGLTAAFLAVATFIPLITHGTESGNVGWAWFLFFGLNALIAAYKPDIFL